METNFKMADGKNIKNGTTGKIKPFQRRKKKEKRKSEHLIKSNGRAFIKKRKKNLQL